MRGGSRNAIAKKRTPIHRVKIKMYATLSILQVPAYPASNNIVTSQVMRCWGLGISIWVSEKTFLELLDPHPKSLVSKS